MRLVWTNWIVWTARSIAPRFGSHRVYDWIRDLEILMPSFIEAAGCNLSRWCRERDFLALCVVHMQDRGAQEG